MGRFWPSMRQERKAECYLAPVAGNSLLFLRL
jgi:hypothetical protein